MHINLTVGGAFIDVLPVERDGNRARIALADGSSVTDLLMCLGMQATQRLLIIKNGDVVPSGERPTTLLHDDDQLSLMPPITAG